MPSVSAAAAVSQVGSTPLPVGLLVGLVAVFTFLVARFLASFLSRISPPSASMAAPPAEAPVSVGELSLDELRQFDGKDTSKPLLLVSGACAAGLHAGGYTAQGVCA